MAKGKTVFFCRECGYEFPKQLGRCAGCGAWNSMVEELRQKAKSPAGSAPVQALTLDGLAETSELRFSTGMGELDRVWAPLCLTCTLPAAKKCWPKLPGAARERARSLGVAGPAAGGRNMCL